MTFQKGWQIDTVSSKETDKIHIPALEKTHPRLHTETVSVTPSEPLPQVAGPGLPCRRIRTVLRLNIQSC